MNSGGSWSRGKVSSIWGRRRGLFVSLFLLPPSSPSPSFGSFPSFPTPCQRSLSQESRKSMGRRVCGKVGDVIVMRVPPQLECSLPNCEHGPITPTESLGSIWARSEDEGQADVKEVRNVAAAPQTEHPQEARIARRCPHVFAQLWLLRFMMLLTISSSLQGQGPQHLPR